MNKGEGRERSDGSRGRRGGEKKKSEGEKAKSGEKKRVRRMRERGHDNDRVSERGSVNERPTERDESMWNTKGDRRCHLSRCTVRLYLSLSPSISFSTFHLFFHLSLYAALYFLSPFLKPSPTTHWSPPPRLSSSSRLCEGRVCPCQNQLSLRSRRFLCFAGVCADGLQEKD